jgi:PAS domain S-box-containing protein
MVVSIPVDPRTLVDYQSLPPVNRRNPIADPRLHSETMIKVLCYLLTFLVALVDYLSALRVSFILFYLLIAALAAWKGGRKSGLVIGVVSSAASFIDGVAHHAEYGVLYWNFGMQLSITIFVVFLVSAVRNATTHLEQRVRERTIALEREITDRKQTEEQLRKTMQQLRQLSEHIVDVFWMREVGDPRLVYVSPAYETIWGRSSKQLYQSAYGWLESVHPEDRKRVAGALLGKKSAGDYHVQYRILRPDGGVRWIRDRAFPIRDSAGKIIRIVGVAEDVTDHRQLEREILEISDREQARIGQDLHDGLCQQLVSLGFDSNFLEQRLTDHSLPEVSTAEKMGRMIDDAITEARSLARGLFPVQLEVQGLGVALQQLAANISARTPIECRLDCPQPVLVSDNTVATHLYRIAQEAVNNAVKHSRATSISLELKNNNNRIELKISDDGTGLTPSSPSTGGMGLHIMHYRARAINGTLTVEPGAEKGTVIFCSAPQPSA